MGIAATVVGALAGGMLMARWTLYRSLMVFGLLQAVSNLAYWLIAVSPRSLWLMAAGVGLENLCGGLGTAAFVGLLMALCRQRFSATQFALLSALSAVGRTYLAGPLTPPLVELFGWPGFFLITVLIAVPGLLLLYLLRDRIEDMVRGGDSLIGLSPARDLFPGGQAHDQHIAGQRLQQPFGHAADGGAQDAGAAVRAGDHQVGPVVERILRQHRSGWPHSSTTLGLARSASSGVSARNSLEFCSAAL